MELEELKEFLRVDGDDLDNVIRGYQLAAEAYLLNAGVPKNYDNPLYGVVVVVFVTKVMETPDLLSKKIEADAYMGLTLNSLVAQLKFSK